MATKSSNQYIVNAAAHLAQRLHEGQVDKAGSDYFSGHLTTVAEIGKTWQEQVVGYLHHASEDTPYRVEEVIELQEQGLEESLPDGVREELATALQLLNHHTAPDRESYIQAIGTNRLATVVKLHDLTHNMDLSRLPQPCEKNYARVERYKKEYNYLFSFLKP